MADGEVKIKIGADSADIVSQLKRLGVLEGDVTKGASESGAAMQKAWAAVVTEGVLARREMERMQGEFAKLKEASSGGGFLGGGLAAFVTGLNQAKELVGSIVSGAVQIGRALYEHAVKPAMELEDAMMRVAALNGGGAEGAAAAQRVDAVANAWQDYSTQGNNEFTQRVEEAQRAGLGMEQAMRAVQSTFIAAQGNQQTADAMLQQILQAAANGSVTERAIKYFERQGLDIRTAIAEQFSTTRDEVSGLLKDGVVGVDDMLGALQRLTGEGTRSWASFQESLGTASAAVRRAENDWGDALKGLGTELLPVVVEAMQEASAAIRGMGPDLKEVGGVLTRVLLVALREAVSFVSDMVDAVRYMWDWINEDHETADRNLAARVKARVEEGAARQAARNEEARAAQMGIKPESPRVADPEDAAARQARQAAARAEKEAADAQEQSARNTVKLLEEADRKRYEWVMHAGRLVDITKEIGDTTKELAALRGKVEGEVREGKTLLTDSRMGDLQRITALEERAAALDGRRIKVLSQRLAQSAKMQIDAQNAQAIKEVIGTKSGLVTSSLGAIGGGGNNFRALENVQLQETKKQTATLNQLQQTAAGILRVMPKQFVSVLG